MSLSCWDDFTEEVLQILKKTHNTKLLIKHAERSDLSLFRRALPRWCQNHALRNVSLNKKNLFPAFHHSVTAPCMRAIDWENWSKCWQVAFDLIIHRLMIEENFNAQSAKCLRKRRAKYCAIWLSIRSYETPFSAVKEKALRIYGRTDRREDGRTDRPFYIGAS